MSDYEEGRRAARSGWGDSGEHGHFSDGHRAETERMRQDEAAKRFQEEEDRRRREEETRRRPSGGFKLGEAHGPQDSPVSTSPGAEPLTLPGWVHAGARWIAVVGGLAGAWAGYLLTGELLPAGNALLGSALGGVIGLVLAWLLTYAVVISLIALLNTLLVLGVIALVVAGLILVGFLLFLGFGLMSQWIG